MGKWAWVLYQFHTDYFTPPLELNIIEIFKFYCIVRVICNVSVVREVRG